MEGGKLHTDLKCSKIADAGKKSGEILRKSSHDGSKTLNPCLGFSLSESAEITLAGWHRECQFNEN